MRSINSRDFYLLKNRRPLLPVLLLLLLLLLVYCDSSKAVFCQSPPFLLILVFLPTPT